MAEIVQCLAQRRTPLSSCRFQFDPSTDFCIKYGGCHEYDRWTLQRNISDYPQIGELLTTHLVLFWHDPSVIKHGLSSKSAQFTGALNSLNCSTYLNDKQAFISGPVVTVKLATSCSDSVFRVTFFATEADVTELNNHLRYKESLVQRYTEKLERELYDAGITDWKKEAIRRTDENIRRTYVNARPLTHMIPTSVLKHDFYQTTGVKEVGNLYTHVVDLFLLAHDFDVRITDKTTILTLATPEALQNELNLSDFELPQDFRDVVQNFKWDWQYYSVNLSTHPSETPEPGCFEQEFAAIILIVWWLHCTTAVSLKQLRLDKLNINQCFTAFLNPSETGAGRHGVTDMETMRYTFECSKIQLHCALKSLAWNSCETNCAW